MPYTFGAGEIPLDSIDGLLEADEPLTSPSGHGSEEAATAIGERVAAFVGRWHDTAARHRAHPHRGGPDDVGTPGSRRVVRR